MKILLVAYHNPNFTNTVFYREQAVKALGHELFSFDDRDFILPGSIRAAFPYLHKWDLARLNKALVHRAKSLRPDLCLVVGGHRVLPETVSGISRIGIKIVLWTTDVPIDFKNILDAAPNYGHLYCAGTEALDIFKAKGLGSASWLPFACDPSMHTKLELTATDRQLWSCDVVFVGSYYPNRARVLEGIADLNLGIWGPYWNKLPLQSPLKAMATDIKMNYDQWVKVYNAAKIAIVVHYEDPLVPCHQVSPKLFEAMACGVFVLTDRQRDVQGLFKDGQHLVFFDGPQDLRTKIEYYLAHEDERRMIAENGYHEVRKAHTYEHRIRSIIDLGLGTRGHGYGQ